MWKYENMIMRKWGSGGNEKMGEVRANYAEATQSESRKDFVHKLKIALKELNESRTWLKIIVEAGYVGKASLVALISESEELSRILSASVITARKGL